MRSHEATIVLLVCIFGSSSAQTCQSLNTPLYGSMQCTGNQVNDRCSFQCDEKYKLTPENAGLRRCVCVNAGNCMWTGSTVSCSPAPCRIPKLSGSTYTVIDLAPTGAVARVTVTPTVNANSGWSVIVIFSNALPANAQIDSFSVQLSAVSTNRRVLTFVNRAHNSDISSRQQYDFTFFVEATNLTPQSMSALAGFYDSVVTDGSCFLDINPITPPTTTTTTTQSTASTATASTTTASAASTTTTTSGTPNIPAGCSGISYTIDNSGWADGNGWNFIFRYRVPVGDYKDWTIKIVFSEEVTQITSWDSVSNGPYNNGKVWFFAPRDWNKDMKNQQMDAIGMSITSAGSAPEAAAVICNNGVVPDESLIPINGDGGGQSTTTTTTSTTTTTPPGGSTVTVSTTASTTKNPSGPSGILPAVSRQIILNFKKSTDVSAQEPYDYNELLHKSILFYEAQRSGKLPANNRIPWRGDSGLKDGCYNNACSVDLTGGWYDAGDFVKFGFPMAWSTTVLALGMIEFKSAYQDAGEWSNALEMLKWSTDYLVKAHTAENELYFQVGDPAIDHANWGHPETMTMDRPIFKIDTSKPGSEVAGETAAALASSYIVFKDTRPHYADNLLSHAIQLYDFAKNYKGHYHVNVPESGVGNFYRSFSGYNDELLWAAIWLYKATKDENYLNDAVQQAGSAGTTEFSWDQKGPGALLLLSQERSEYKSDLFTGIDFAIAKTKTPGGLTHFSDWGSNRYSANYALIALATAKMEGVNTAIGQEYYNYGKGQIEKLFGKGDGSRSYVVGFGTNPPQRPHHRASSCRSWNADPTTQVCDWSDRDADRANPQILYGALVGGPTSSGFYIDDRKSYVSNEVAVDYNAGFQSAVAALKYFQIQKRAT